VVVEAGKDRPALWGGGQCVIQPLSCDQALVGVERDRDVLHEERQHRLAGVVDVAGQGPLEALFAGEREWAVNAGRLDPLHSKLGQQVALARLPIPAPFDQRVGRDATGQGLFVDLRVLEHPAGLVGLITDDVQVRVALGVVGDPFVERVALEFE
jgi:hypothetical protein